MSYDVGGLILAFRAATVFAKPPRVTPRALNDLVAYLEIVTRACEKHLANLRASFTKKAGMLGGSGHSSTLDSLTLIEKDLDHWRLHLVQYRAALDVCAASEKLDDAECTLWSVVAPLFFGIFDGPLGTSDPGTPTLRQPFTIANQLEAVQTFQIEDPKAFVAAFTESAQNLPSTVSDVAKGTLRLMGEVIGEGVKGAAGGLGFDTSMLLPVGGVLLALWVWRSSRKGGE